MEEKCKLSAISLALSIVTQNEDLTKRLIAYAEESNLYSLYADAIKEGTELVDGGIIKAEAGTTKKGQSHTYSLKAESADIKFKSALFGSILANTDQGDDALRMLMNEMKASGETVSSGLLLLDSMANLNLKDLESITKQLGINPEQAEEAIQLIRDKVASYTGTVYSAVTHGNPIKCGKQSNKLLTELNKAKEDLAKLERQIGKEGLSSMKEMKSDIEEIDRLKKDNKGYFNTKQGQEKRREFINKYGLSSSSSIGDIRSFLEKNSKKMEEIEKLTDEINNIDKLYKEALADDFKLIKEGQNPFQYMGADNEWKFNKTFNANTSVRVQQYGQYVLARTILLDAGGELSPSVYKAIEDVTKREVKDGVNNYLPDITEEWLLSQDRTLEEVMARAFTNTKQLIDDGQLRDIYRQRILELASEGKLGKKDVEFVETLLNISRFSEAGAGFSSFLRDANLVNAAKNMGLKVGKKDGTKILQGIKNILSDETFKATLKNGGKFELMSGVKISAKELLELICADLKDLNLYKLIASNKYTDADVLKVASVYFAGDIKGGNKRLFELINNVKNTPTSDDIRGVILKALTGREVPKDTKLAYFNFKSSIDATEETGYRKKFYDRLTERNKIRVGGGFVDITTEDMDRLVGVLSSGEWSGGGFIIVNNNSWKQSNILKSAVDKVNEGRKADERIEILFPRGGMASSFVLDGNDLLFRTTNNDLFTSLSQTLSIRAMGNSEVDSRVTSDLVKQIIGGDTDAILKYNRLLEQDAYEYFGRMLGTNIDESNVKEILESATGISFKNYSSIKNKQEFWKRVDEKLTLGERVTGKFSRSVVDVSELGKRIDNMSVAEIASDLSRRFGFQIDEQTLTSEGKALDEIRDLFFNLNTSRTNLEYLENKGRILAYINGSSGDVLTISSFSRMLTTRDYSDYKNIFFNNPSMTDEEISKYIKPINDMIFDNLAVQLYGNLINLGYQMPGNINIKEALFDYINGKLSAYSPFGQAFLYKNGLQDSGTVFKSIFDEAMPQEINFKYDSLIKRNEINTDHTLSLISKSDEVDSTGSHLSKGQKEFFKKSAMRDENGNLVKVYRGSTQHKTDIVFGKSSMEKASAYGEHTILYFTSDKKTATSLYGGRSVDAGDKINSVKRAENYIKNVIGSEDFKVTKEGKEFSITKLSTGENVFKGDADELTAFLRNSDEDGAISMGTYRPATYSSYLYAENPLVVDAKGAHWGHIEFNGKKVTTDDICRWAADNGYDGVIIKQVDEGKGAIDDYIVFDQSQVKGTKNLDPTDDYRWDYQVGSNDGMSPSQLGIVNGDGYSLGEEGIKPYGKQYRGYGEGPDLPVKDLLSAVDSVSGFSVEELLSAYGIPYKIDGRISGYGATTTSFRNNLTEEEKTRARIALRKMQANSKKGGKGTWDMIGFFDLTYSSIVYNKRVSEGTPAHEFFHAVCSKLEGDKYTKLLDTAQKLYGYSTRTSNEMLADLFAEYFKTGEIKLPKKEEVYNIVKKRYAGYNDKKGFDSLFTTFIDGIKDLFGNLKTWLGGVNKYEEELKTVFDDVLSLKYADIPENQKRAYLTNAKKRVLDRKKGKIVDTPKPVKEEAPGVVDTPVVTDAPTVVEKPIIYTTSEYTPAMSDGYASVVTEISNPFVMGDTYSALSSMAVLKKGDVLPGAGNERNILEGILRNYYNTLKERTSKGTLTFAEAQRLKMQAGYMLDTFEQDYLMPKYKRFLTQRERGEMFGLKYGLGISVDGSGLDGIANLNQLIMDRFDNSVGRILDNSGKYLAGVGAGTKAEIAARQGELIEQGATIKNIGGTNVVVDVRTELKAQLANIPNTVHGLEAIRALGESGIEKLSNKQAYFLLNMVQLAKNADNKLNIITNIIYKLHPNLAKIDFFNSYRVINGVPMALKGNLLDEGMFKGFSNLAEFDTEVKKGILDGIGKNFRKSGELSSKDLEKIIVSEIDKNIKMLGNTEGGLKVWMKKKNIRNIYMSAFNPYVSLVDVPSAIKKQIDDVLKQQQSLLTQSISELDDPDVAKLLDTVFIKTATGDVLSLRGIMNGEDKGISKALFDTEDDIIKAADEAASKTIDPNLKESTRISRQIENKEIVETAINEYKEGLQAYLNNTEIISNREKRLRNVLYRSARQLVEKYANTAKFSETDNALAGLSDDIVRRLNSDILGFVGDITNGGLYKNEIMGRFEELKLKYQNLYYMSPDQFKAYKATTKIDALAYELVRYFKEIEGRLGSADGLKGVSNSIEVNKAFGNLGEVVLNIRDINGILSFITGVEGNQILKFFRFSDVGHASYIKELKFGGAPDDIGLFTGIRRYVDTSDKTLDYEWFNKTFGTNFTDKEYKTVIQGLTGMTVINKKWEKVYDTIRALNYSNTLLRTMVSYPFGLLTVWGQGIAYYIRQKGWEKALGMEDMKTIDGIRTQTGILDGAYNEINIFRDYANYDDYNPNSVFNRYGIPDIDDVYNKVDLYSTDDIESLYGKLDEYFEKESLSKIWKGGGTLSDKLVSSKDMLSSSITEGLNKFIVSIDAYKDNANNIIDGLFARNFKNIAFEKAIVDNNYIRFSGAKEFYEFMNSAAPQYMKNRVMEAVTEASGRNFRNILGIGFSGLDRAYGGGWIRNLLIGMGQLFNFRGAWGRNIFRQTNNFLLTSFNMLARNGGGVLSKEGREAIADYVAKQPEFTNFIRQIFNELLASWKLVKIQDNGQFDPEADEYSLMDFLEYIGDNMNFTSQWMQGLQSYGRSRMITEGATSMYMSMRDPEIYRDYKGIGALFNALASNFARNWKPVNFLINAMAAGIYGKGATTEYIFNEFYKLSAGTLRYMYNDDTGSYGFSRELITGKSGIPTIFSMQSDRLGDKQYSYDMANTETYETLKSLGLALEKGDVSSVKEYTGNLFSTLVNSSQGLALLKNTVRAIYPLLDDYSITSDLARGVGVYSKIPSPYEISEGLDIISGTNAGKGMMDNGYYIPTETKDIKILIEEMLYRGAYRPGNTTFNKGLFSYDEYGHMGGKDYSNDKDLDMEFLLANMKYERNNDFSFKLDKDGKKIVTDYWKEHLRQMKAQAYNSDYLTVANYNFVYNWVELNNDDPNYMLYKSLLGEGKAYRMLEDELDKYKTDVNEVFGLKKTMKLTESEAEGNLEVWDENVIAHMRTKQVDLNGERYSFLEALEALSQPATDKAIIRMIENQLAQEGDVDTIRKFFDIKQNEDGSVSVNLTTRYEEYIKEQARLAAALNEGDVDKFLAETASITNLYTRQDPYGNVTLALIASRANRINEADSLTAEQKAKAIEALFKDNYDFIQKHIPEMIDELGEDFATAYIKNMNEALYDVNKLGVDLVLENEANNSKSGTSSAKAISNLAKGLTSKLASGTNQEVYKGKSYDYNFVPVTLKGAELLKGIGGKGYNPVNPGKVIISYNPHSRFSIGKDVARKVKPTKTSQVSNKKQLTKLEDKYEKAVLPED